MEMELVERARSGDRGAMEELIECVRDRVFNLSLRMLGSVEDAEDATQEILLRAITGLGGFRGDSLFSTWVYRIAVNALIDWKKGMYAHMPMSFEIFEQDALHTGACESYKGDVDRALLAEELKMSCTGVMLKCLNPLDRMVFILGTMFHVPSAQASELLEMGADNYRQRLHRAREKMSGLLGRVCGLAGGPCDCAKRVDFAISCGRLNPAVMPYHKLAGEVKDNMEKLDQAAQVYGSLPRYRAPEASRSFLAKLLASKTLKTVTAAGEEHA